MIASFFFFFFKFTATKWFSFSFQINVQERVSEKELTILFAWVIAFSGCNSVGTQRNSGPWIYPELGSAA